MFKKSLITLIAVLSPALALTSSPAHAASPLPIALDADVVRVVSATSTSVTYQLIHSFNHEWNMVATSKGSAHTYTSALPKADRSKPVLSKNSLIKITGQILKPSLSNNTATLTSITRTSSKCQVSQEPYNVVICKAAHYHVRWMGAPLSVPSESRATGKCSYYLNLVNPQGAGPGVPLKEAFIGVGFGLSDTSAKRVSLTVTKVCKTSSVFHTIGTFSF